MLLSSHRIIRISSKTPFLWSLSNSRRKIDVNTHRNISSNDNPLKKIFNYLKPKSSTATIPIMDRQPGSPEDLRLKAEMEARNRNVSTPSFKGFNPEKDSEDRIPVTSAFEIGTFLAFLKAAKTGDFPGNKKTELPLWPEDQMQYFTQKYVDWAPPPYSELPQPAGPLGNMPGHSPPAMFRVMNIISGMDALLMGALDHLESTPEQISASIRNTDIARSAKLLGTRLWYGLAPMSEAHWKAKALDEEKNIEEALSILQSVVDYFEYTRRPDIVGKRRNVHNKVYVELDVFQDACDALYATRGERKPGWSLSKLWQEYVRHHFEFQEHQARAFLLTHLLVLQKTWKARMMRFMTGGRIINSAQATIIVDHLAIFILNKIEDLYMSIDLLVHTCTDGFVMVQGVDARLSDLEAPAARLNAIWWGMETQRRNQMNAVMAQFLEQQTRSRRAENREPDFLEPLMLVTDREFAHKSIQYQITEPPVFGMEPWVRKLDDPKVESFGFLVYRLSYSESDEEWAIKKEKIIKEIEKGWEGVVGGENVKRKAVLRWIDGRKVKIEEGDLEGARKHFVSATVPDSPNHIPKGLTTATALAVTSDSLKSFNSTPRATSSSFSSLNTDEFTGDFRPFIHAIDPTYEQAIEPTSSSSTSQRRRTESKNKYPPGYKGSILLPLHLAYTDLYALRAGIGPMVALEDMWAIGTRHPWGLYTGPTTGATRRQWRQMRELAGIAIKHASDSRSGGV